MENFEKENNNNTNPAPEGDENTNAVVTEETTETADDAGAPKTSWQKEVLDWSFSIIAAIVIALLIRNFVFTLVNVDGNSMNPTLTNGDKLYVSRIMYKPKTGDIIILHPPQSYNTPYVKRIVALEGQVVDIKPEEGAIYVDGEKLEEDYVTGPLSSGGNLEYPFEVPKDCVFVMGDNRNPGGSTDSRLLGPIPVKNIMGKAIFRILPLNHMGNLYK